MVGIVDSGHVFLFFFMEGMNVSHATIGSMDLWYVYLHKWLISLWSVNVGEYAISMDHMGYYVP